MKAFTVTFSYPYGKQGTSTRRKVQVLAVASSVKSAIEVAKAEAVRRALQPTVRADMDFEKVEEVGALPPELG